MNRSRLNRYPYFVSFAVSAFFTVSISLSSLSSSSSDEIGLFSSSSTVVAASSFLSSLAAGLSLLLSLVVPRASPHYFPFGNYNSHIRVITVHAEPLRKSIHFLHQYASPFAMLTSVLFYKKGLYISTQHCSKHWRGSPFTGLPHHHLVSVEIITSILVLIVSILL
jgi:hypothetical protein